MFYSSQLLSRKTALGICWLASHLESKRLKRAQVFEVSIAQSCDSILNPEAPLALRLSGQLLLGVVRIYQRKLTFLETDAKNAIEGLQRKEGGSQNVDLPDNGTAPEMAITLPDVDIGFLAGAELFPSFQIAETPAAGASAPGGGLAARLAHGTESLTFADDISDVLGSSRWTATEERFDLVGGDNFDRRFSAELERLRSAAAVEAPRATTSDLFFDIPVDDSYGGAMGEIMEPPAEDLFVMPPLTSGPTPGSLGGAPHNLTPPSLGGISDFGLPDFGGFTGPSTAAPSSAAPGTAPNPKKKTKKRVQIDVNPDGSDGTQLPSAEMKKLLENRASLLKQRGLGAADVHANGTEALGLPSAYNVRIQSEAARESFMYRPACCDRLSPDLLAVFNRALGVGPDGKVTVATKNGRQQQKAKASAADAEAIISSPGDVDQDAFGMSPELGAPSYDGGVASSPAPSWGGDDGAGFDYEPIDEIEDGGAVGFVSGGADGGPAPLELTTVPSRDNSISLGGLLEEPSEGGDGNNRTEGTARISNDGFTARTKVVLDHLANRFTAPPPGQKRRRGGDGTTPLVDSISLDSLVIGRPRLEACRWFFEALVLRNKHYVDLKQDEPYGTISIVPLEKLMHSVKTADQEDVDINTSVGRRQRVSSAAAAAAAAAAVV